MVTSKEELCEMIAKEHAHLANLNRLLGTAYVQHKQTPVRETQELLDGEMRATRTVIEKTGRIASLLENLRDDVYTLPDAHKAAEAIEFLRNSKDKALEVAMLYEQLRRGDLKKDVFIRKKIIFEQQLKECIQNETAFGVRPRSERDIIRP